MTTLIKTNTYTSSGDQAKTTWYKDDGAGNAVETDYTWVDSGGQQFARMVMDDSSNIPWNDGNHRYPGLGWLNLLTILGTSGSNNELPSGPHDLTGGYIEFVMRLSGFYLPPTARLYFWIQTMVDTVAVNMINVAQPIDQYWFGGGPYGKRNTLHGVKGPTAFRTVRVDFTAEDHRWKCLGSNTIRTGVNPDSGGLYYGGAPIAELLASFSGNMGIIALHDPDPSNLTAEPTDLPYGTIDLNSYTLHGA